MASPIPNDPDIDQFVSRFISAYRGTDFTFEKIAIVTAHAMEFVEKHSVSFTGSRKKEFVQTLVIAVLDRCDTNNSMLWDDIAKLMLPTLIDQFMDVNSGSLRVNESDPEPQQRSCWKKFEECVTCIFG
jgi:hypothetical protein